jgi:hypothetical protein
LSPYQSHAREDLFHRDERDPYSFPEDEDDPEPMSEGPQDCRMSPRLPAALAVGFQAGAFRLCRRRAGSLWTALGVGLSAGLVAFFGGGFLADCAVTLGSVLALAG